MIIKSIKSSVIWKIKIDPKCDLVAIEYKDTQTKFSSFYVFSLIRECFVLENFSLHEDDKVSLDDIYDGVVFLHNYTLDGIYSKTSVIAIDAFSGEKLWQKYTHKFSYINSLGVCCLDNKIQFKKDLFDVKTGELIKVNDIDNQLIDLDCMYSIKIDKDYPIWLKYDKIHNVEYLKANNLELCSFVKDDDNDCSRLFLAIYNIIEDSLLVRDLGIVENLHPGIFSFMLYKQKKIIGIKQMSDFVVYL